MTLVHTAQHELQPVDSAQRQLLERAAALGTEPVGLDRALGRILAEAIESAWDLPGFDNSAMDGYAVRATDVAAATPAAPVALRVTGSSQAGIAPQVSHPHHDRGPRPSRRRHCRQTGGHEAQR